MTLYTIGCANCKILEMKLDAKNIKYDICEDVGVMINMGINKVPVLEIDNRLLEYKEAVDYINTL